jgi:hypothetical protein
MAQTPLAAGGDDVEPAHRTLAVHDAIAASTSCYMPKNVRVLHLVELSKERQPNHGLAAGRGLLNEYRSNHDPG